MLKQHAPFGFGRRNHARPTRTGRLPAFCLGSPCQSALDIYLARVVTSQHLPLTKYPYTGDASLSASCFGRTCSCATFPGPTKSVFFLDSCHRAYPRKLKLGQYGAEAPRHTTIQGFDTSARYVLHTIWNSRWTVHVFCQDDRGSFAKAGVGAPTSTPPLPRRHER